MKRPILITLALLLLAPSTLPAAGAGDKDRVVAGLQGFYRTMKDYEARFTQESRIAGYPRAQTSSGQVYYLKPGRMRWNYDHPEPQEIVTDGKTVWMYTPSLNQVMKADFEATSQSKVAQAFLSGMGEIEKDFEVAVESGGGKAPWQVRLTPRDKSDPVERLLLTVAPETFHVLKSEMTDIYGNTTVVSFSDLKINGGLKKGLFDFKVPAGVDVVTPPAMQ